MRRVARVLVIDDQPLVADAMKRILSDEFEVSASTHPEEAFEILTFGDWYDVVFCDVMMPAMNGVELHRRVQAVRADLAARFVFITGGISWPPVRALLDEVPNLVLEKPLEMTAVRELVHRRMRPNPAQAAVRS
jgi:DNA-binding NtrC family response regulator